MSKLGKLEMFEVSPPDFDYYKVLLPVAYREGARVLGDQAGADLGLRGVLEVGSQLQDAGMERVEFWRLYLQAVQDHHAMKN